MYPQAYLDYLIHFHVDRDYFECHEVLEEYWKDQNQNDITWVGLIQIAVALYHQRRGNFNGAEKMMKGAMRILQDQKNQVEKLGLQFDPLILMLKKRQEEIRLHRPYSSVELPLQEDLKQQCLERCKLKGGRWNSPSDLQNEYLIHKHAKRDRQEVMEERQSSLERKARLRPQ